MLNRCLLRPSRLALLAQGFTALLLTLRLTVGDRWGWLGMVNAFTEWTQRANLALALVRLWNGHADALLLAGPALLTNVGANSPRDVPEGKGQQFTVLGANLYLDNEDFTRHLPLIEAARPDVIALHELTVEANAIFMQALADRYPYQITQPQDAAYGFGVFSRFPLRDSQILETPGVRPWAQRVLIDLTDGQSVALYNMHLCAPTSRSTRDLGFTWGFRTREAQVATMAKRIITEGYPAIIIGDHNFSEASVAYRMATRYWTDAWAVAKPAPGWTWPMRGFPYPPIAKLPAILRLDYCFVTGIRVNAFEHLTQRTGSDHRALLATVQVAA